MMFKLILLEEVQWANQDPRLQVFVKAADIILQIYVNWSQEEGTALNLS